MIGIRVALFDANAMLAREATADIDAKLKDFSAHFLDALQFTGLVPVVQEPSG